VRVTSAQTRQKRCHEAGESDQGITSERAKQQIEPNDVGFQIVHSLQKPEHAAWVIKCPAAHDIKSLGLDVVRREFVGQNRKVQERIALQLPRNVKPIFTQAPRTWGKGCNQTDLHSAPVM